MNQCTEGAQKAKSFNELGFRFHSIKVIMHFICKRLVFVDFLLVDIHQQGTYSYPNKRYIPLPATSGFWFYEGAKTSLR